MPDADIREAPYAFLLCYTGLCFTPPALPIFSPMSALRGAVHFVTYSWCPLHQRPPLSTANFFLLLVAQDLGAKWGIALGCVQWEHGELFIGSFQGEGGIYIYIYEVLFGIMIELEEEEESGFLGVAAHVLQLKYSWRKNVWALARGRQKPTDSSVHSQPRLPHTKLMKFVGWEEYATCRRAIWSSPTNQKDNSMQIRQPHCLFIHVRATSG